MIINVEPDFSFEKKTELDLANPIVQKWETLMSTFQKANSLGKIRGKMVADGQGIQLCSLIE